jgi:hypothetical protein
MCDFGYHGSNEIPVREICTRLVHVKVDCTGLETKIGCTDNEIVQKGKVDNRSGLELTQRGKV